MEAQTWLRKEELDYFYNVLMDFLKRHSFDSVGFQWRGRNLSGFIKKVLICVSTEENSNICDKVDTWNWELHEVSWERATSEQ